MCLTIVVMVQSAYTPSTIYGAAYTSQQVWGARKSPKGTKYPKNGVPIRTYLENIQVSELPTFCRDFRCCPEAAGRNFRHGVGSSDEKQRLQDGTSDVLSELPSPPNQPAVHSSDG